MGEWITALEGTDAGRQLALVLALSAAVLHAIVSAMQKARFDPWMSRASIDFCYGLMAAPVALFVLPWPEPRVWPILAAGVAVHTFYKVFQAMAFTRGDLAVVYPIARGIGPLVVVVLAGAVFGETFTPVQWTGLLILVGGIFGLAAYNLLSAVVGRKGLAAAIVFAVFTGLGSAGYTTIDAYGIRVSTDPFVFLAWLFLLDSFFMPIAARLRRGKMPKRRKLWRLFKHGSVGAVAAVGSFGGVMLATRLDNVGQAVVLRETAIVFAALIGWFILKETVGPRRMALILLIAAGAVIVELGG